MRLCTIGTSGKNLRRFIYLLKNAEVYCVIDVRLNNTSQLLGYAKQDDLEYVLSLFDIHYEHHTELAPTEDLLVSFRKDKDWNAYTIRFAQLINDRDMISVGRDLLKKYKTICLLCSEDGPEKCHRRLIAESWAEAIDGLEVEHLK